MTSKLKMIDEYERALVLGSEEQISFDDVLDIYSELSGQSLITEIKEQDMENVVR